MKLIGVTLLTGLMTTVVAVIATSPRPSPVPAVSVVATNVSTRRAALDRYRAASAPDTRCEAAWDAERRRFFGEPVQ